MRDTTTVPTAHALAPPDDDTRLPSRSLWRLFTRPFALLPAIFLLLVLVCAIGAPWIAPFDPFTPNIRHRLEVPGAIYWLGTDDLGRDILSRVIYGARTALIASLESVGIGVVAGVSLGLLAGYVGGWLDRVAMRFADVMQSIPAILLALALIGALGKGLGNAMLAVGIIFSISFMRITRAVVLAEREQLYVDAARVLGLRPTAIMLKQILPNVSGPLIVQGSISLGTALLIEAMLSFLGVGADSTQVSWGSMLETARQFQNEQPLLPMVPGLAITLTVLSFNLLGDTLRDALLPSSTQAPRRAAKAQPSVAQDGTAPLPADTLLEVRGLTVRAGMGGSEAELLSHVSLHLRRGEVLGLVGESGCGKSMTANAILSLLPRGAHIAGGSVRLAGTELVGMPEAALRHIRGKRVGMVFQDPNAALSPVHTIGMQLEDIVRAHNPMSRDKARARAIELLDLVGVPDAARRLQDYPHQFSGGQRQRVAIARALACDPELLIADEPTTALVVTTQSQLPHLPSHRLTMNCRNLPRIGYTVNIFSGLTPGYQKFRRDDDGTNPVWLKYQRGDDQSPRLREAVQALRDESFDLREILVLSPMGQNSVAATTTDPWLKGLLEPADGRPPKKGRLRYATIHAFKGLEAPAVIVSDLDRELVPSFESILYVGLTRATDRL